MPNHPHRLQVTYMADRVGEEVGDRFSISWKQVEDFDHWEAYRSLPGINQEGQVPRLDGTMLMVFGYMRDILAGKIWVNRDCKVVMR